MNEAVVHLHPSGRLAALVGNPNVGLSLLLQKNWLRSVTLYYPPGTTA